MNPTSIKPAAFEIGGVARMKLTIPADQAHLAIITGMTGDPSGRGNSPIITHEDGDNVTIEGYRHNAFVNQGLQAVLDSAYGDLTPVQITHIALSGDSSTVIVSTSDIDPGSSGFSPKVTANVSRTGQTVSADNTWTDADVSYAIVKIGLLTGALSTDVVNIIGGTGGSTPYDEPFTIDLTSISTWSLQMGVDVTATAS
jgi:hypothetical protein